MERDFEGKVALVTGAARGLGYSTAKILATRGASLMLVDLLADRLEATRAELEGSGAQVSTYAADIAEREACFGAVAASIKVFGRLDVLCNVAGIVRFNRVPDTPAEEWDKVMAINLRAPFFLSQAAIPHLLETKGNIVNVASQSGTMGTAYIVAYSASKGGLVQMTRSMAMEYMKSPIRINAVCPGAMSTEIGQGVTRPEALDMELIGRYSGIRPPTPPEEVAELIAFVASDKAAAIHGACLAADGGVSTG
jgi:NAD(P)-dependent dehydrogenase (short-subunit alcohol dehydrogenase family)